MILAWVTGTAVVINTPLFADAGNTRPSTHHEQVVGPAHTTDTMLRILRDSGVLPQLSNLAAVIIGESRQHWHSCGSSDVQLESWLNEMFATDEISRIAIRGLRDALETPTITNIVQWLDSPSGQSIIEAERLSASVSENEFERHASELGTSPAYRTERMPRIRELIGTTRAGNFVSVLNTELNSLVSLSIACSPSSDAVQALLGVASAERQDLGLVSLIMNINLYAPTAVVYRDVEDRVIDDYLEFSKSPAGKAYHSALINVTRNTLADRLDAFASRMTPDQ